MDTMLIAIPPDRKCQFPNWKPIRTPSVPLIADPFSNGWVNSQTSNPTESLIENTLVNQITAQGQSTGLS